MKIATLAFAGSESSLGLTIVSDAVHREFPEAEIKWATEPSIAKEADYLFVSLYWWKDVFELVRYLATFGIDPRKKKPTIIIGGMAVVNPRPIKGYFHYCVIGDGEEVIVPLLKRIEAGEPVDDLVGVWNETSCEHANKEILEPICHIDLRTNKTTRIEIARGCKQMCDFCQLAWSKPYRELGYEQINHLLVTAKTKNVALFCPDTWSHSQAEKILARAAQLGKNNTGTDVRLDMLDKISTANAMRFGLEGFSEKTRRRFRKVKSNADFQRLFVRMASDVKTPKGKSLTTATMYMIGDLPGEGQADVDEFWQQMIEIDRQLKQKFTLFLSVSSFTPSPFTPMWCCPINLEIPFKAMLDKNRPRLEHIVIASRGAVRKPAPRLCQMMTIRGDERLSRVIFWLATKAWSVIESTKPEDGEIVKSACKAAGYDWTDLVREYDHDEMPPWGHIRTFSDAWRTRAW